jgi:hypothetical protein
VIARHFRCWSSCSQLLCLLASTLILFQRLFRTVFEYHRRVKANFDLVICPSIQFFLHRCMNPSTPGRGSLALVGKSQSYPGGDQRHRGGRERLSIQKARSARLPASWLVRSWSIGPRHRSSPRISDRDRSKREARQQVCISGPRGGRRENSRESDRGESAG